MEKAINTMKLPEIDEFDDVSDIADVDNIYDINDFEEKGEYELKANEKVCTVTFEVLKEYIALKSPKKFKSTSILQEIPVA